MYGQIASSVDQFLSRTRRGPQVDGAKRSASLWVDMAETRATVTCPECDFEETFTKLATARVCIEDHRTETGHEAFWEVHRLSAGVERAGDHAGVCGIPGTATADTPLVPTREEEEEN